jgi:hypothetical protein
MGTIANILGFGLSTGPHYQLDYSTATGAGITTASQATLASSNGISNICFVSSDGTGVSLRSDVDVDPIASNGYPRSEWRELATNGTSLRAFTPTSGDHKIEVLVLPEHLPPVKTSFVVCQMHDQNDDIIEIALQPNASLGVLEVVGRVNGSSRVQIGVDGLGQPIYYTWPKLIANFQWGTWLHCWIRVGAIHSGATGYEFSCNGVTVKDTDNVNMPAMAASGANSYFKSGMYLQTKWTGSGTGGLETDRNEYGQATWRVFKTTHNGETAPVAPVVGSRVEDTISGVTWGTPSHIRRTVNPSALDLTPALPSGLTNGDMLICWAKASRGPTSSSTTYTSAAPFQSTPSTPGSAGGGVNEPTGWTRVMSMKSPSTELTTTGAYPGGPQLEAHLVRIVVFVKQWVSGDTAPTVVYASGGTLTDTMVTQVGKCSGAKLTTALAELFDQLPDGYDASDTSSGNQTGINYAASTSTTTIGPTAATPGTPKPGALALAYVAHETNATVAGVGTVTGGTDSLSWAEAGQYAVTTVSPAASGSNAGEDEQAWALDWAIVPMSGYNQVIPAKSAATTLASDANKPNTAVTTGGCGYGTLFTISPAKRHRHSNRTCTSTG